jgi:hypothetical protein
MAKVFFSYSHKDEDLRNELETHLAGLKRQRVIETWHDRRIGAGKEFANAISIHLEQAEIILLLVSPYFIASDYCYDVEMKAALSKHETGEARVIPIILHPCDWHSLPFGKLLATPKDGKPISKFPNIHDAFLDVTLSIKEAAGELEAKRRNEPKALTGRSQVPASVIPDVRSSNLRVKKTFTDREKDQFQAEAFEYVANFFEQSLTELKVRNSAIETEFRRIDANRFTSTVYVNGAEATHCRIWLGGRGSFSGGIAFKSGRSFNDNDNSFNESLSVSDDGHTMFLQSIGFAVSSFGDNKKMTLEGAGEFYWELFIRPLQR